MGATAIVFLGDVANVLYTPPPEQEDSLTIAFVAVSRFEAYKLTLLIRSVYGSFWRGALVP